MLRPNGHNGQRFLPQRGQMNAPKMLLWNSCAIAFPNKESAFAISWDSCSLHPTSSIIAAELGRVHRHLNVKYRRSACALYHGSYGKASRRARSMLFTVEFAYHRIDASNAQSHHNSPQIHHRQSPFAEAEASNEHNEIAQGCGSEACKHF